MAAETLKSTTITNYDALPAQPVTSGMGSPYRVLQVDDFIACTAVGIGTATSSYRLCRFPTWAKVKALTIATDVALDTNASPTLAWDINVAFSEDTTDFTPVSLQALIPTTANTGATTTLASYTAPNKIFGSASTPFSTQHTVGYGPTDVGFAGSQTTYNLTKLAFQPLWQTFGFVDGRGNPSDPGGNFDILIYISTGAATGAAGNIYARLTYA